MNGLSYVLTMRRLVAAWSDRMQKDAAKFADDRRDLLPRRITNAQLYSLKNIVRAAHHFADIQRFIRHQREKAERAGRLDVLDYWASLDKALSDLRVDALQLQKQAKPLPVEANLQATLDGLHCQLAEAFVQHLIAHSLCWTPLASFTEGKSGKRGR